MARPKVYTQDSETALLEKFNELAEMVDTQIKSQPPLSDLDAALDWVKDVQALYSTLGTYEAQAKALLTNAMYRAI